MKKRDPNPGGYIGEAMASAKRVRKPRPFSVRGCLVACASKAVLKPPGVSIDRVSLSAQDARRLARWLNDAADWMEDSE